MGLPYKKATIAVLLFSCFLFSPVLVHAQKATPDDVQTSKDEEGKTFTNQDENKEPKSQSKTEPIGQLCDRLAANLDRRIEQYERKLSNHTLVFENISNKLFQTVEKYESQGFESEALNALREDAQYISDSGEEYAQIYGEFISILQSSNPAFCATASVEFSQELVSAKQLLVQAKALRAEVRQYYMTDVRLHWQQLREDIAGGNSQSKIDEKN